MSDPSDATDDIAELKRRNSELQLAYRSADRDRNQFKTDLEIVTTQRGELQDLVLQLTADRNDASKAAQGWEEAYRSNHPEDFDAETGEWHGQQDPVPSSIKMDNSVVPGFDNDVAPEPTSTQVLPAAKRPSRVRGWANNAKSTAQKIKMPNLNG